MKQDELKLNTTVVLRHRSEEAVDVLIEFMLKNLIEEVEEVSNMGFSGELNKLNTENNVVMDFHWW